jgi:hypothetical protein
MRAKYQAAALTFLAASVLLTESCNRAAKVRPPAPPSAEAPIKSPSGKTYARARIAKPDNDEPLNIPPVPPGAAPSADNYHGSARMAAKLSIGSGAPEDISDIGTLLHSLPADKTMRAKHISQTPDSGRLPEEQRNVTVTAFLYASSKESDNDFHCIVGRDPKKPAQFMNVEVSGLPPSSSEFFATLKAARNQFKVFFTSNADGLPAGGYDKYDPPISITVTGSLFFDVDHVPPAVGPQGMKPKTAWEIHPVSKIEFEQ